MNTNWKKYKPRNNFNYYNNQSQSRDTNQIQNYHENVGTNYRNQFKGRNPHYNNYSYNKKPYDRNKNHHHRQQDSHNEDVQYPISPQERNINDLLNAVQRQGVVGQLVFIANEKDNSTAILQNAIHSAKDVHLNVTLNIATNKYELTINDEVFGETSTETKQQAKSELCENVLNNLKKKCFFITRMDNFEEVSTQESSKNEQQSNSSLAGSKAYSMMLKMGWGGKGLGVQEQGDETTVADKMPQNISKEGLGSKNVINEVDNILQNYISSSKITTLVFDSSFSKDERAQIHNLAQKYNLKSKSQGKEPDRRITITRKMAKWDLVKELLRSNLKSDSYTLEIPEEYQNMWHNNTKKPC